ncbi:MAG: hypothetical protein ACRC9T_07530, partial [Vibrionaceae bacterium]
MQPTAPHNLGANGAAQAQEAAGSPPSPDQPPFNITAVHNTDEVSSSLLGDWQLITTLEVQNLANITLHLQTQTQTQTQTMQATTKNQGSTDTAQSSPLLMQPFQNATAITAAFTVEELPAQEGKEPQCYHLDGFANRNRLALNPINAADRQIAAEHSCTIVCQATLNAMEVLADAAICIENHALEQTLTARQSLKEIKFRRHIAPITADAQPQRQSGAMQPDAAEQQNDLVTKTQNNDDAVKERLLDLIERSHYHFNP